MFSNSVKNIHKIISRNSPTVEKRSSKLLDRIKLRQSLNRAKPTKYLKHSAPSIHKTRRNSDIELQKLRLRLDENEDLKHLDNAKDLIILIAQLNGAKLNKNFDIKKDPENNILIILKKFMKLFEKYEFFFSFFNHYNIPYETILAIIPHMRYIFLKKYDFIYKEGEECKNFYFLLKGKISFNRRLLDNTESEQFSKDEEGFHFGEWQIINNRNNKYSALCKENCYLIYISKEIFKRYIVDRYTKIEADIKNYLMNNLRNYVKMPTIKLERFIESNIKSLFFRKNDIIFKKGEETKYLYLLYKGEVNILKDVEKGDESSFISFRNDISIESILKRAKKINYKQMIKKYIKKDEESKNNLKLEMSLNKNKYNIMTTLTKGSFIGLEITTGVYFFKYTYTCKSDFASILEINIENLDEHLKELMINLIPFFLGLDEKIHQQMDKISFLQYNLQPKSIQKMKTRNKFYKYNKFIDFIKIDENEKTFLKQIKKIDQKFDTNEAGFIKMNQNNTILQEQKNILIEKLRENYFKSQKLDIFIRNFNKERVQSVKYRNVKMLSYHKDKNKKTDLDNKKYKNNSFLFERKKAKFFLIDRIVRRANIKKIKKEKIIGIMNNNHEIKLEKSFNKFKSKTTTNNDIHPKKAKNLKNYNLYDIEAKKDMEQRMAIIKNNKIQYQTFLKLQRKKNNIKDIKQGLSLDCKSLVKKVYVKNLMNDNKTSSFISCKNKDINNSNLDKIMNIDFKNNLSNIFGEDKRKKIIKNIFGKKDKKLNFYDTGVFDMPLVTQLGLK